MLSSNFVWNLMIKQLSEDSFDPTPSVNAEIRKNGAIKQITLVVQPRTIKYA